MMFYDPMPVFLFLGVISICLILVTGLIFQVAYEWRKTLQRINVLLPACHQIIRRTNHMVQIMTDIVQRVDNTVTETEELVERACGTVSDAMASVRFLAGRAQSLLGGHPNGVKNGVKGGKRSGKNKRRGNK